MNAPVLPAIEAVDGLLMDVARRIQLSPTKHDEATTHYEALCTYVEREGSPLAGKVLTCYPGGSFSIGAVVASSVSRDQHDVDVVVELDFPPTTAPALVLGLLAEAIRGEPGSRYFDKARVNSRCITVTYEDGTHVDLMPVARLPDGVMRSANLFHKKSDESYVKPVNPFGFAAYFNSHVAEDRKFFEQFRGRRVLIDSLAKAETQPMPNHVPLEEKSPRVVALQLLKRARDMAYKNRTGRRPPSVMLAAMALDVGPVSARLIDELMGLVRHVRLAMWGSSLLEVRNPAYYSDVFTDRWPGDLSAQREFAKDLDVILSSLARLRNGEFDFDRVKAELRKLFGETAAQYAVESYLDTRQFESKSGQMRFAPSGRVLTGAAAVATPSVAARANTFAGGELPE